MEKQTNSWLLAFCLGAILGALIVGFGAHIDMKQHLATHGERPDQYESPERR